MIDFSVIQKGKEFRILQLTDMQVIDSTQKRFSERLNAEETEKWQPQNMKEILFDSMDKLVAETNPDLIIITGDITYGEFDDTGKSLLAFIEKMESYNIPWAPVWGNHDNESVLGVDWQCQQFINAKNCLFKKGITVGCSNYIIGIKNSDGELNRLMYMMDSNGCANISKVTNQADKDAVKTQFGFTEEQLAWYRSVAVKVNQYGQKEIPSFLCMHIPPAEVTTALVAIGYQEKADTVDVSHNYQVGSITNGGNTWTYIKDTNKNFGFKEGRTVGTSAMTEYILPYLKAAKTDGTFFGHQHINALSVEWEGIRYTYGLKTGRYDESPNKTGGTVITLNGSEFDVNHSIINNPE